MSPNGGSPSIKLLILVGALHLRLPLYHLPARQISRRSPLAYTRPTPIEFPIPKRWLSSLSAWLGRAARRRFGLRG